MRLGACSRTHNSKEPISAHLHRRRRTQQHHPARAPQDLLPGDHPGSAAGPSSQVNPGDVQIIPFGIEDDTCLTVETLFKIEAEPTEKRHDRRLDIIDGITKAFREIFPKSSTVITLYLTLDGYRSTHPVEMPKVKDMSMKAAIERAKARIEALHQSS